jgi:hypothetical protein
VARCCRAAATRQRNTAAFDSTHVREPGRPATPWYRPPPTFHKVTFLRDPDNWQSDEVIAVGDEQGNDVTFDRTNITVYGGGLLHVVNAVSMHYGIASRRTV